MKKLLATVLAILLAVLACSTQPPVNPMGYTDRKHPPQSGSVYLLPVEPKAPDASEALVRFDYAP